MTTVTTLNTQIYMTMKTISIEIPDGKKAEWKNGVLTIVDEKDNRPVTERIKTYEDAWKSLGYENDPLLGKVPVDGGEDIFAYLKLRIIVKALNEGWEPQFTTDEYRWYPWFYLYTQEEIDKMDEAKKKRLVLFGGYAYHGSACGLVSAGSYSAGSDSSSDLGSRLALKSEELADYCGKQFADIWADFVVIKRQNQPGTEKSEG